jgi:hypothetical protein
LAGLRSERPGVAPVPAEPLEAVLKVVPEQLVGPVAEQAGPPVVGEEPVAESLVAEVQAAVLVAASA